jgi:hydrogenase maturation factor
MKPGKLPHDLLAKLIERLPSTDPSVLVGPRVGEDAAVLDLGDRLLICATDPITFATDLIGWYAVHVNANDVAVMGGAPRWFLATLLLPEAAASDEIASVFEQMGEACEQLGVTMIGGHTEITIDIDRPIVVGCMLGEAAPDRLVTSAGAQPGDVVVLAGGIAIEGTAILGREAAEALRSAGLDPASMARACDLLFEPGISVVPAARAAAAGGAVTAMHDPTEGGLATGLRELALASGVGLEVEAERIPVLPLTRSVCAALDLNALGLIASGSLLVTVRPEAADEVVAAVAKVMSDVAAVGRVTAESEGLWLLSEGKRQPLPEFPRDELARFFDTRDEAD